MQLQGRNLLFLLTTLISSTISTPIPTPASSYGYALSSALAAAAAAQTSLRSSIATPPSSNASANSTCANYQIFELRVLTPFLPYSNYTLLASGSSLYLYDLANLGPIAPGNTTTHDRIARFYRNDTTHLYATGFDLFYAPARVHWMPPYEVAGMTRNEGFVVLLPGEALTGANNETAGFNGAPNPYQLTTGNFTAENVTTPNNSSNPLLNPGAQVDPLHPIDNKNLTGSAVPILEFVPNNTPGPGGWYICGGNVMLGVQDLFNQTSSQTQAQAQAQSQGSSATSSVTGGTTTNSTAECQRVQLEMVNVPTIPQDVC